VELLALIRESGITGTELRGLLELSPRARKAVADLIAHTARAEKQR
jgi:hypothetical protein